MVVMMEDEFSLNFVELHQLTVEFGGDGRLQVFGDLGKLLGDVDLHDASDCSKPKKVAKKMQPVVTDAACPTHNKSRRLAPAAIVFSSRERPTGIPAF